jgi:hypothetical protein
MDRMTLASVDASTTAQAARAEYWRVLRDRIGQVPGVEALTLTPAESDTTFASPLKAQPTSSTHACSVSTPDSCRRR